MLNTVRGRRTAGCSWRLGGEPRLHCQPLRCSGAGIPGPNERGNSWQVGGRAGRPPSDGGGGTGPRGPDRPDGAAVLLADLGPSARRAFGASPPGPSSCPLRVLDVNCVSAPLAIGLDLLGLSERKVSTAEASPKSPSIRAPARFSRRVGDTGPPDSLAP